MNCKKKKGKQKYNRIGIDLDGVIADFTGYTLPILNKFYNVNLKRDDITHYNYEKVLGVSKKEMMKFWEEVKNKHVLRHLKTIEGALEALSLFKDRKIYFFSMRPEYYEDDTIAWLKDNNIDYCKLHIGQEDKSIAALKEEIDIFIEDNLLQAIMVSEAGIETLLFNQPWNHYGEKLPPLCKRVYDWKEIINIICDS